MSFLGFGARSSTPNRFGSIQIQTSERGVVVPYAGGTVKLPLKLLDYVDFQSIAQTANSGGGSGGGGGVTGYEYFAAIDGATCTGPADGIGNIYDAGGGSGLSPSVETYTIPAGGGTYRSLSNTTEQDEGVTFSQTYSYTANDFGSDGSQTFTGTQQAPMQKVAGSPGAGQYSVAQDNNVTGTSGGVVTGSGGFLHYTFSAADAGKTVTITYTYTTDTTNYVSPAAKYNFGLILGPNAGQVWGYMASNHPERALAYPNLVRVVAQNYDLGTSAEPPNISVEILNARKLAFGSGIADCDPAQLIADICGDSVVGMAWPYVGDLTQFSNFCVANNLFQSVAYDSQRKALQCIKEIADLANSEVVYSSGLLKIVPYGDSTAVANGRTFTPQTQPIYEIDYSDLIVDKGGEPIITSRPDLTANYNALNFQYTRRDDNYNTDVLPVKNEASISMFGLLPAKTVTGDNYRVKNYAAVAADMLLKRNSVPLRQYKFKLKWWYQLLEPMDILLLKPKNDRPVRVVQINENPDYSLDVIAEDFLFGVGTGILYPKGDPGGNSPARHAQPGDSQLLAGFQPNTRITGGANQLWFAFTGGPNWGGCNLRVSRDNVTYSTDPIATLNGSSRAGILTAPVSAGSDPDTSNTLAVSIAGSLASVSQADADAYVTLSLLGKELVSFETATLTGSAAGSNSYNLSYLRRGIFANNAASHAAGEIFVRLDNQIVKYNLDPSVLNTVLYFKATSFNLYGLEEQDLDAVAPIAINLGGTQTATNMVVGAFANSDGTTATVNVYRQGAATGTAGSGTLANGATISLPAQTYASQSLNTWYGVNYNPATSAYVIYTNRNQWVADQSTMLAIGSVTTPAAGSGGGGAGSKNLPTQYSDTGSSPTNNPAGAYTSGQSATLSSSATFTSNSGGGPITA